MTKSPDDKKVLVRSRTYKEHWRAKRGSVTEAKLNDALQQSTEHLKLANKAAQLIKLHLDPFRQNFMGGLMWHQLVKRFKEQLKLGEKFHTANLVDTEVWKQYPLSRFGAAFNTSVIQKTGTLQITIKAGKHPDFKRSFTNSYRISLLVIFPDFEEMEAISESCISDAIYTKEPLKDLVFNLPIPEKANSYLLVLKVEGTNNGFIDDNISIKGMRIVDAGNLIRD